MNVLTDENIAFIYKDLQARGLTMEGLIDELLDHICCTIESDIHQGLSFEKAYDNLIRSLDKNTFKEIQHQTILSTNLKFQKMKNTMISFGVLGTLLLVLGVLFKTVHLPGGSIGLSLGTLLIVFGFLPLFFYSTYKEQLEKKNGLLTIVAYLTIACWILGALFRMQHWPGREGILLIAQVLFIVVLLPVYLIGVFKKAKETKTNVVYVVFIIGVGLSTLFMSSWFVTYSPETLEKFAADNANSVKITSLYQLRNDSIIAALSSAKDSQQSLLIEQMKQKSEILNKKIDKLKNKLIKSKKTESSFSKSIFGRENLYMTEVAVQYENEAYKLKESFEAYRKSLLELASDDYHKALINSLLKDDMYAHVWEDIAFEKSTAMLSEIQEKAQIAQFGVLLGIK